MIKVENLCKVYNPTSNHPVKALTDVSFTLPDKGMIFIIGKSGSGKSTFLNLLGGLDKISSGRIVVNGNDLTKMSTSELDDYRNKYIGFVFQNFCLLEDYSVYENINIVSYLNENIEVSDKISEYLDKFGLSGLENRKIVQLSGGQLQRVSIIRALIKNPDMILADEPTGNLDSKSAKQTFETLKEISKDRLVVVISHDLESARIYADRMIELADGKVIADLTRNKNYVVSQVNQIEAGKNCKLTEDEFKNINKKIESYQLKLIKQSEEFYETGIIDIEEKNIPFAKNNASKKAPAFFARKFIKSNLFANIMTSILISIVVMLLCVYEMFQNFDVDLETKLEMNRINIPAFSVIKGYSKYGLLSAVDKTHTNPIPEEEVLNLIDAGNYEGNYYYLYNQPILTAEMDYELEKYIIPNNESIYYDFYAREGTGTMVTDKEYIEYAFKDGKENVEFVCGSYDELQPLDLIITDYFADCILFYSPSLRSDDPEHPYANICNHKTLFSRYRVGAIINTNYKERYENLISKYEHARSVSSYTKRNREYSDIVGDDDRYHDIRQEGNGRLNIAYSINPNYIEDLTNSTEVYNFSYLAHPKFYNLPSNTFIKDYTVMLTYMDSSLQEGKISMNYSLYNSLFNTSYSAGNYSGFTPTSIKLDLHNFYILDENEQPAESLNLEIVSLHDSSGQILFSSYDFPKVKKVSLVNYSVFFDNIEHTHDLFDEAYDTYFYHSFRNYNSVDCACGVVEIFAELFALIVGLLLGIALLLIISHSLKNVKNNKYEIGVLRALGGKISTVALSFTFEIALLCLLSSIGSIVLTYSTNGLVNTVLRNAFVAHMCESVATRMVYVRFSVKVLFINLFIIWVVGGIAMFAPLKPLKEISPTKIMKE